MAIPFDKAHVHGNPVTGPAWPAHPDWLAKFLKLLGTKIEPWGLEPAPDDRKVQSWKGPIFLDWIFLSVPRLDLHGLLSSTRAAPASYLV